MVVHFVLHSCALQVANDGQDECQSSGQQAPPEQQEMCRLCLQDDAVASPPSSAGLVSCCGCQGSIKYIHPICLLQWQQMLWSQGQFQRALQCDICCQPYQQQHLKQHVLPLWQRVRQYMVQLCRSPELAFRAWRCCILLGGLAAGTRHGMTGFSSGLNLGLKLARPLASFTLRLVPQLSVAAAVLPSIAPMLRSALRCSCGLMIAEVGVTSAVGLFGGGLLGFCLGSVGVMKLSAAVGCLAASTAVKVFSGAWQAWPRVFVLALLRSSKLGPRSLFGQGLGC